MDYEPSELWNLPTYRQIDACTFRLRMSNADSESGVVLNETMHTPEWLTSELGKRVLAEMAALIRLGLEKTRIALASDSCRCLKKEGTQRSASPSEGRWDTSEHKSRFWSLD